MRKMSEKRAVPSCGNARARRKYTPLHCTVIQLDTSECVLNASIVEASAIESVGQSVGDIYDMSEKTFNHEWDGGSN